MKVATTLTLTILAALSNGSLVGKRDVFSPFDPKDTPSSFSNNDLKDALLAAQHNPKSPTLSLNNPSSNSNPSYPPILPPSVSAPAPNKPQDVDLRGKANVKDDGSLYYYYYPSKSENRDNYGDSSSSYDSFYDLDTSAYNIGGGGGYGGFFDLEADHTRYLLKVALPLFILGAILFTLSSAASSFESNSRNFKKSESFVDKLTHEVEQVFNNYLSVLESDDCLSRIICEAGYITPHYSITKNLLRMVVPFIPEEMKGRFNEFRSTVLNKKDHKKCHKFRCDLSNTNIPSKYL